MDPFFAPPAFTAVDAASNGLAAPLGTSAGYAPASFNHPPYEEMIFAAFTALKENDGLSKNDIGKYIERVYSCVPLVHSVLLTQHLERLTNSGALVLVNESYKLPGSEPPLPAAYLGSGGAPITAKRGRGRPPKPKLDQQMGMQPVLEALGLADEPVKKGRGRPKQDGSGKRGRGRPPKDPNAVTVSGQKPAVHPAMPSAAMTDSNEPKRRPGRPPKNQATPNLVPYAASEADGATAAGENVAPGQVWPMNTAAVPGVLGKRQGRPPKVFGVDPPPRAAAKPRKVSGKPLGRPRKKLATEAWDTNWATAYGDAKKQLEYFQSKVQRVVAVLKPQLDMSNDDGAAAAMEELEGLATMDINAAIGMQAQPSTTIVAEHAALQS